MAKEEKGHEKGHQSPAPTRGDMPAYRAPGFPFMRRFSEDMDRLFGGFFGRGLTDTRPQESGWFPDIDVVERDNAIVIRADLPGMTKDDLRIEVSDHSLAIEGERRHEEEKKEEGYYRCERQYGHFYRSVPLPEGADVDHIDANFKNGVLEITVPTPQRSSGRRIEVH